MHRLAVAVTDGVPIFELAIPCEVFGYERPGPAESWYDFRLCAAPGTRTAAGFAPAAGILDGRPATTHWMHAARLADRHPEVRVDASVLYIDDGDVLTSAGTTAGLDLCLHVVRNDHGAAVASALAKRLVMPAHRPGGQAQYTDTAISGHDADDFGPVPDWARRRMHEPLTVAALARRANVTPRTLHRRFHATTGTTTTPMAWLRGIRIDHARELLETTSLPVPQIAERTGLGSPANLRHHFTRAVGVPPTTYRRAFSAKP